MRVDGNQLRQSSANFRRRLDELLKRKREPGSRVMIDSSPRTIGQLSSDAEESRFTTYGRRRFYSVGRVLALFEIMREVEHFSTRKRVPEVKAVGAFWQAFRGTKGTPACHTCPALLLLDQKLPCHMTRSIALRRRLVVEFADCMIMPGMINDIDSLFDDMSGWSAFEQAGSDVLSGHRTAQEAQRNYAEQLRYLFPDMQEILQRDVTLTDPEQNRKLNAMRAFYEGLFLTPVESPAMRQFVDEVRTEVASSIDARLQQA